MGKVRVKTIGDEETELKQKDKFKKKKEAKIAEKISLAKEKPVEDQEVKLEEKEVKKEKKSSGKKSKKTTKKQPRSKSYTDTKAKIDRSKSYSVSEGIELLKKLQRTKFDETVELHLTMTETGISGKLTLPYGTGKKTKVVIADETVIAEVEKGKIDFDILVADPSMMPKLAKVAKVLGPRGLMPNPKNGTITNNPQELVKKYEGGQISFRTESKSPIIHFTIGKVSFEDKKLNENIKTILKAVNKEQIEKITLSSTMSPGIKLSA
ncbi:MAG: 50S ribosomal protein L1 [Candidatus Levyibacteriota bacterium]